MIFLKKLVKHDEKKSQRNNDTRRNFTDLISGISNQIQDPFLADLFSW